jgi:RecB family exonuclease
VEAARRAAQQTGPQGLPAPLELSFSKIKKYLDCPRCFYLQYVLKLSEAVSDELSIGQCLHAALKEFNTQRREAQSEGRRAPALDELIRLSRRIHRDSWPRSRPYDENGLRQIEAQARRLVIEMEDGAQILEIERTITFDYACAGERHRFKAVLDRLDQLDDGGYRIVDFKTGKATKTLTEPKPDDLQMCIYAMAVARFYSGSAPAADFDEAFNANLPITPEEELPGPISLDDLTGSAEYWVLATGQKGCISFAEMDLDKAQRKIDKAITGIRAGRFERGKDCDGGCEWLGTL